MPNAQYTSGDPSKASIALVGEAPGADEETRGGAFVGSAGRLIDELLSLAGISRSECYFDNVFQFRPENNNLDPYINFRGRSPRLTDTYYENRNALIARLKETKANVVVALGNVPLYAMTERTAITKQRGSVLWSEDLQKKVIPCIHPASAIREYLHRYWIVYDLKRTAENMDSLDLPHLQRDLILDPSFADVKAYLETCMTAEEVAYDIEVKGHELSHISFALSPTSAICIPFVKGLDDVWTPDQEAEIMIMIAKVLENDRVVKIGQNLSFDATFLYTKYGIVAKPLEDTMIAAGILYPDFPKGLDFLVSLYCNGEPYYKDDGKEWFRNPFGSEGIFRRYNALDSAVLMEVWPSQRAELIRASNLETYERQKALLHPLVYAGNKGFLVDIIEMRASAMRASRRIAKLELELLSIVGKELNPNSPKQLQQYFYIEKGLKAYTKKGRITVDDKALKRIAAKGYKEAGIILDIRHEKKMLSTYYEMELDEDERLRCSYNPVGTEQGRISSSKTIRGTGSNLQNQPPDMRAMMMADHGYILINQDLAQAENRVVAYVFNEERMIYAFENGIDIHSQTGAIIHRVPLEKVTPEIRADGKTANHGLNYDLGARSFAIQYQMDEARANYIVEVYHRGYPGVRQGHAAIRYELSENNRVLVNCFGRRRIFLDRWNHDLFKVAYSYIPQSTVGELMNQRGVVFLYNRQDLFPEVQFLNTVHDSIQYQIPLSVGCPRIIAITKLLKESLETPLHWKGREFYIPTDTQFGFSLNKNSMMEWKAEKVNKTSMEELVEELETYVKTSKRLD